jgi:hypothetical protein
MNLKTLYATLAAFVVTFLLSWLVWGILLMDFYEVNTTQYEGLMKESPNMVLMILGSLLWCFFFTIVIQKWAKVSGFGKGFVIGLVIAFFVAIYFDFYYMATMNMFNWTLAIVDILLGSVVGGITGGVAGLVLGLGKKKADG